MDELRNVEVYSRVEACPYCVKAKELLQYKGVEFKEIVVGGDISRDDFQSLFQAKYDIKPSTVPQITVDGYLIGGYTDLENFFISREMDEVDFAGLTV